MKAYRIATLGLLLVGSLAGLGLGLKACGPLGKVEKTEPAKRAVVSGTGALGTLVPAGRARSLSVPGSGAILATLLVEEGSEVQAGQLLATTDEHELRGADLRQAEARVEVCRAALAQTRAGAQPEQIAALQAVLVSARETLRQRERDWKRSAELQRVSAVSSAEVEQARLAVESATQAVNEAEARLSALKQVRDVDIRLREAELKAAEGAAEVAKEALGRTRLLAPIGGKVLRIMTRPGERTGERGVLELGDVSRMQVIAEVYEADATRVQTGSKATARVKSTGLVVAGRVVKICPLVGRKVALDNDPVSDTDARVVEVWIDLDQADSERVSGLTNARVEVRIEGP